MSTVEPQTVANVDEMVSTSSETLIPEIQVQIMRNVNPRQTLIALLRASQRIYQVFQTWKDYLLTQLPFTHFRSEVAPTTLEALVPEIQVQIMRNVSSRQTLIALLRASPRFYQVFRTRKDYLLTQLAFSRFRPEIIHTVWSLAKTLQLPRPATRERVYEHTSKNFYKYRAVAVDEDFQQPSITSAITIPLCRMGETIAWFVQDYRQSTLPLLTTLGTYLNLQQDQEILGSDLSAVERGRLQRAFCRFETFCCLFVAPKGQLEEPFRYSCGAVSFLGDFEPEEVEELACVRDYLIRRLWGAFDAVESDAIHGEDCAAIRKLGEEHEPYDWFSYIPKRSHPCYMEYLMSQGLPFLRDLLESDGIRRAKTIISNSAEREYFLTFALKKGHIVPLSLEDRDFDGGLYDGEDVFEGDDVLNFPRGLLWANRSRIPNDYARWALKGLRDWGYVFWDDRRLQASGVLDQDPKTVADYRFNEQDRTWRWSVRDRVELPHLLEQPPLVFAKLREEELDSDTDSMD
ncbi:MAG: hypothetical protein L6R40_007257 [Gallowayella cf. fulva]|nr:MAG: hypothetical protein L6R40_007257 [Xanthomendoza cf. fulva]